MRFGFVIDQRKCIGCHACTVACKEENQVPLGAFRTWVKYVERGTFPNARRYFSVLRCNHCDSAPCVTICPTVALYRRPDGIVDLDGARCIGCKSCMQACPYDALYIDPDSQTAAKCHYCAHRVEVGLAPACVIVCPEQAIVAGDLDDPASPVARLVAREQVQVRKPEQGTRPKVFYLGADTAALSPELQASGERFMWSQRPAEEASLVRMVAAIQDADGRGDGARARAVYDVPHAARPWGWKVAAYLWTKSIAAGAALLTAGGLLGVIGPAISLLFLALTTALLILDLKRPDRFLYILLKPNRRSWLVWGAWILLAFGAVETLALTSALRGTMATVPLFFATVLLAAAAAGYSAFLFGQAEGRDFWQSPLKLPHLVVTAIAAGSAALLVAAPGWTGTGFAFVTAPREMGFSDDRFTPAATLVPIFMVALALHALLIGAELFSRHASHDATVAARLLRRGALAPWLWGGALGAGVLAPLVLAFLAAGTESTALTAAAALLALAGLWIYEDAWVKAGQSIPLS
ncbi:MAG TPA: 4Fe-4S dicluster domain-containing protein [Methylomirabilota bacterium]|nr:4Fe-4S dicluster domain-containing protein [Methylomirabilota bacterium]